MPSIDINLPAVPGELKTVAPFVSRAQELKGKDPVIAYYCLYHAVQTGIGIKTKEKDSKMFLMDLMTTLENMKAQLKDRKEIGSDEAAASYIENFALKVFSNADNEDRKGGSTRSTAKKFLAASNFFELLVIFDQKFLNKDIQPLEKIKYAKWKAADIAKAFREGRVPQSGPPLAAIESEDEFGDRHSDFEDMSMGSSAARQAFSSTSTDVHDPPATAKPLLPTTDSSSSLDTIVHNRPPALSSMPKHNPTGSMPPVQYVVDVSSPSPVSSGGSKTPLKSPIPGDGQWSTAATPGLESPNFGSWGKAALNSLNPATLAMFNSTLAKSDSPLSPGVSPKPRSGLGTTVVSASDLGNNKTPANVRGPDAEDAIDTDEEDGQWSTAGNDPFSRQNSMMPVSSGHSFNAGRGAPGLMVTPSLGAVHEEASPQKKASSTDNLHRGVQNLNTPAVLAVPLPPSANNSVPSSPGQQPGSVAFAASHPLPPLLPPSSKTPSSIKSESHALPTTTSDEKGYKYTTSIVGDSTSDSEASYNVRRRANTVVPGGAKADDEEKTSSYHVRSSSVNTAAMSQPPPASTTSPEPSKSAPASAVHSGSSADDDWERASLSRLARLPDSVNGSDMDSLSGRLRDLDTPNSSSASLTPLAPDTSTNSAADNSFKSRRNTIRANAPSDPRLSGDFGFSLPGVPSAPPIGDWKGGSGNNDSDSGGEGDVMARLPSAPAIPPIVQDQLPHVAIFHKPASPRDELRVNPHFPSYSIPSPPTAPAGDSQSPLTPRNQSHSRTPSATSSGSHGPVPPPPPPASYGHPPPLSTSPSGPGSSAHRGYTPPNSVVTPQAHYSDSSASSFSHPYSHYPQGQVPQQPPQQYSYGPPPPAHYAPAVPTNMPAFYGAGAHPNGINGTHDEFGLGIAPRAPPTELDPDTIGKAQKHAKFALSALNFDDLETAREELKKALRLLS